MAMFLVCSIMGFLYLGIYGIIVGAIATLIERIPKIDDNITVPLITALLVYIHTIIF